MTWLICLLGGDCGLRSLFSTDILYGDMRLAPAAVEFLNYIFLAYRGFSSLIMEDTNGKPCCLVL